MAKLTTLATALIIVASGALANPTSIDINSDCITERNELVRTGERAAFLHDVAPRSNAYGEARNEARDNIEPYRHCMRLKANELLAEDLSEVTGMDYNTAWSYISYSTNLPENMAQIAISWDNRVTDVINSIYTNFGWAYDRTWSDLGY